MKRHFLLFSRSSEILGNRAACRSLSVFCDFHSWERDRSLNFLNIVFCLNETFRIIGFNLLEWGMTHESTLALRQLVRCFTLFCRVRIRTRKPFKQTDWTFRSKSLRTRGPRVESSGKTSRIESKYRSLFLNDVTKLKTKVSLEYTE